MNACASLRSDLADDDPLLAAALVDLDAFITEPPTSLIEGSGIESDPDAYRYGIESIREGHLLHWSVPRLVRTDDSDLRLLAGDRLYAAGLERIASTGDRATIRVLSRLIMASAEAHADGRPSEAEDAWEAACAKIGRTAP